MKTPLLKSIEVHLQGSYFHVLDSCKDGSSKLNNHSAMTFGKIFLLFSSTLNYIKLIVGSNSTKHILLMAKLSRIWHS